MRLRNAEDGKHRVADELLAQPAVPLDLRVHELEELTLELADVLRLETPAQRSRTRKIREQDPYNPAFLVFREVAGSTYARLECSSTRGTEGRLCRLLGAARGTCDPERRAAEWQKRPSAETSAPQDTHDLGRTRV